MLRELRLDNGFTQQEAAEYLNVSLRTYIRYEKDSKYINTLKYEKMCDMLSARIFVDESHGILKFDNIKLIVGQIFDRFDISCCYLFGSYAKGKETEKSDVDLLIDSSITGAEYFGLLQELIDTLHKNVDLIKLSDACKNLELLREIMKDGIKIYG